MTEVALLCLHGRGWKPAPATLAGLWQEALQAGLQRDAPAQVKTLATARIEHLWFGDLNADLLADQQRPAYDEALDVADLRSALAALAALKKPRKFRREHYEALPGKSALKEFAADVAATVGGRLGLGPLFWRTAAPEVAAMLAPGVYRDTLVARVESTLADLLDNHGRVMVLAHCVGSVALWHALSGLQASGRSAKVDTLVTMGSPLADDVVRASLPGFGAPGPLPGNLVHWLNLAAEDDYLCHDETMANDFAVLRKQRLLSRLEDRRIYNLAVRFGRSNPHCVLGYLVHPRMAEAVAGFLAGD